MENVSEKVAAVRVALRSLYPGAWACGLIRVSAPSPVSPNDESAGKRPIDKKWQVAARDRYASGNGSEQNIDVIANHACSGGNVGLAVPKGTVVLDADSKEDFEKLRRVVPAGTPLQRTARGGHAVLRTSCSGPIKNRVQTEYSGMKFDLRGEGGQIVVAPSIHRSGTEYVWERSLPQRIEDVPVCPTALETVLTATASAGRPKRKRLKNSGDSIPKGERNSVLASYAGKLRRDGLEESQIAAALLATNAQRCKPPLPEEEVNRIAHSIANYPPGNEVSVVEGARFEVVNGSTVWLKPTRGGGFVRQRLANFIAWIVREETHDDGAERRIYLTIAGRLSDGTDLPSLTISADDFQAMTWVANWGTAAIIEPGSGSRERLRCAIQSRSPNVVRTRVVAHLGWREDGGVAVFHHAGGAIGRSGPIPDVSVEVPSALERFVLPDPPVDEDLKISIRAVLRLVLLGPARIMITLLAAVFRSIVGGADFTVHLVGHTGTFKTALAAVIQAHFGKGFDADHLPGSWLSTTNSLERIAFFAKDALMVVDDFAPAGSPVDVRRQNREVERLLRSQGNRAGRGRMNVDGSLQPVRPPRGLILSTGEDVPGGQSARARTIVIEVSPGDIDASRLAEAQREAADGQLAAALAGYIQWLAPQLDAARQRMRESSVSWRSRSYVHRRTPNALGQLAAGFDLLLRFAAEAGAVESAELEDLQQRAENALLELGEAQLAHQRAADPVDRFIALIVAALTSGKAHIASANDPSRPPAQHPERYGWRKRTGASSDAVWAFDAQGTLIGWRRGGDLFLEPETAFELAQGCARGQGDSIPVGPRTLWKRLDERGLLIRHDKDHLSSKVKIGTSRQRVIHLRGTTLFPTAVSTNGAKYVKRRARRRLPAPAQLGEQQPEREEVTGL